MPASLAGIFEYRRRLPICERRLRATDPILVSDELHVCDHPPIIYLLPTCAHDLEAKAFGLAWRLDFGLLLGDNNPAI